jgi:hypothetical protein
MKKLSVCKVCKKEYNIKETIRTCGETPVIHNCCSAQCYTKMLMENATEKKDKILKAADDIAAVFNMPQGWLDHDRSKVVKILKQLVEESHSSAERTLEEKVDALVKKSNSDVVSGKWDF